MIACGTVVLSLHWTGVIAYHSLTQMMMLNCGDPAKGRCYLEFSLCQK